MQALRTIIAQSIRASFRPAHISSALLLCAATSYTVLPAWAQEPNPAASAPPSDSQPANPQDTPAQQEKQNGITEQNGVYIYHINVVQRDLDAVNYLHRSGSTTIGFEGTSLLPAAKGEAKVTSERGGITIDANFKGLPPANGFGKEYLTYVLWAISADGRPVNLGEVLPNHDKNNIHVTTSFQSFGMIVTAEPYFSVSQPSDVVVLQNVIRPKTVGELEKVNVHYALLPRGMYAAATEGAHTVDNPITRNMTSPLELYEAHNAYAYAASVGAEKYAADIMSEAKQDLQNADEADSNKHGDRKMEVTMARQAVQRSEDARLVSLRKQAAERQRNADLAKDEAQQQAAQSALAAEQSQLAAEQAQAAKAQADAERARAEADAATARARAAEASKSAQDANAVREQLRAQLNSVLATSETARGLIVHMSDVLFDTGKYTLKPDTKISLAKVAGILQAYPGLKLQVEGYTDSVGSDDYNQKLSENRSAAVKDFLVSQGVTINNITSSGYGKQDPVADNTTSQGRAQNRRVQMVVSGDAIGIAQQTGPNASSENPAPIPASGSSLPTGQAAPPQQ
jgi:outer membrane protein OmpA-like peptidoglycan-associated protein